MSVDFAKKQKKRLHHYFIPSEHNDHKPHLMRHRALHTYGVLLIGLKILVLVIALAAYPSAAEFSTITSRRILELTNAERQKGGVPILMRNAELDRSAMMKAQDMLSHNYFAHNAPSGTTPWEWFKRVDYIYTFAGENLAMNFSEAEDALAAWMDSPSHQANILNANYDELGVGVAVGEINGQQTTLVVQHFGKSYLSSLAQGFGKGEAGQAPAIAGSTQASAESVEIALKGQNKMSFRERLIYYAEKFFLAMLIFVVINLTLTIFIRIRVQHKPIIMHSLLVIAIGLFTYLIKLHFIEQIVGGTISIM